MLVAWCLMMPRTWAQAWSADCVQGVQSLMVKQEPALSLQNTELVLFNKASEPLLIWQKPAPAVGTGLTILAGASPMFFEPARRQNVLIRERVQMWRRNEFDYKAFHFDNFTQFVPVSAVMLLNLAGVPSRDERWSLFRRAATSMLLVVGVTQSLKFAVDELRPDRSSLTSFPSGHTAFAFSGAEMLRLEYSETSVWIPVAGYAVAALTGFMRIYNDRHWAGDVLAGAGVGLLTADLSFWLNDWMDKKIWKR